MRQIYIFLSDNQCDSTKHIVQFKFWGKRNQCSYLYSNDYYDNLCKYAADSRRKSMYCGRLCSICSELYLSFIFSRHTLMNSSSTVFPEVVLFS